MNGHHRLSDGLFDAIYKAVTGGENWVVFDEQKRYLQRGDLYFFRTPVEARRFINGRAGAARFGLAFAYSVLSLYRQIEGRKPSSNPIQSSLNNSVMNEKNLAYLKEQVKYLGFGDKLYEALEKELAKGSPAFQLTLETEIAKKAFAAVLNFRKSDNTDLYFFNSYHATLQRGDGEIRDQAFYLRDGKGVTAKEAFNLLDGRAVHKELETKGGEKYNAWLQLDFDKRDKHNNHEVKQFHERYGFDLKAAVSGFAIAELAHPDKAAALLQSLQKGNLQAVTVEKDGLSSKMYLEATPRYKTVTVYDDSLNRVPKESLGRFRAAGQDETGRALKEGVQTEPGLQKESKANRPHATADAAPGLDRGRANKNGPEQTASRAKKEQPAAPNDLLPKREGPGTKKGLKAN